MKVGQAFDGVVDNNGDSRMFADQSDNINIVTKDIERVKITSDGLTKINTDVEIGGVLTFTDSHEIFNLGGKISPKKMHTLIESLNRFEILNYTISGSVEGFQKNIFYSGTDSKAIIDFGTNNLIGGGGILVN